MSLLDIASTMACTDAMTEDCAAHNETHQLLVAMRTLSWRIKSAVQSQEKLLYIEVFSFSATINANRMSYLYGSAAYWFNVGSRFASRT